MSEAQQPSQIAELYDQLLTLPPEQAILLGITTHDEDGQAQRLEIAEQLLAEHSRRSETAYANAAARGSLQEPLVRVPFGLGLVESTQGDLRELVSRQSFEDSFFWELEATPRNEFFNDEDGQRWETVSPLPETVDEAQQRLTALKQSIAAQNLPETTPSEISLRAQLAAREERLAHLVNSRWGEDEQAEVDREISQLQEEIVEFEHQDKATTLSERVGELFERGRITQDQRSELERVTAISTTTDFREHLLSTLHSLNIEGFERGYLESAAALGSTAPNWEETAGTQDREEQLWAALHESSFTARVNDLRDAGRITTETEWKLREMVVASFSMDDFQDRFQYGAARMMDPTEQRYLESALPNHAGVPETWQEAEAWVSARGLAEFKTVEVTAWPTQAQPTEMNRERVPEFQRF